MSRVRRDLDEQTEFLMFTLWDSLAAVRTFAGQDYETAVFYPEDDRFLVERDPLSTHYFIDAHSHNPTEARSTTPARSSETT